MSFFIYGTTKHAPHVFKILFISLYEKQDRHYFDRIFAVEEEVSDMKRVPEFCFYVFNATMQIDCV